MTAQAQPRRKSKRKSRPLGSIKQKVIETKLAHPDWTNRKIAGELETHENYVSDVLSQAKKDGAIPTEGQPAASSDGIPPLPPDGAAPRDGTPALRPDFRRFDSEAPSSSGEHSMLASKLMACRDFVRSVGGIDEATSLLATIKELQLV